MRALLVAVSAAAVGLVAAWGATKAEFRRGENPVGIIATPAIESGGGRPKLEVDGSTIHDFGTMGADETGRHVFVILNLGDAPLTLTKGKTTCTCTLSELEQGPLAPGETREVTLEWTPKTASDRFSQSAEIITNDPERSIVQLVVQGAIRDYFRMMPPQVNLGEMTTLDAKAPEVKIWSYRLEPFTITNLAPRDGRSASHFTLSSRAMTPDEVAAEKDARSGQVVQIAIEPGLPIGSLGQKIRVEHNYADEKPLEIEVNGKVVGDITLLGAAYDSEHDFVRVGSVSSEQGFRTRVYIAVKGPHRSETNLSVRSADPASSLQATLGEPKDRNAPTVLWPLDVEVPVGAEPTNRVGTEVGKLARIELDTTHPDVPVFAIRVRMTVTNAP
jgi:hypothetical protein